MLEMENRLRPRTAVGEQRRIMRGDFGPSIVEGDHYPSQSSYATVENVLEKMDRLAYCRPDRVDASNAALPEQVRQEIDALPADERCVAGTRYLARQALEESRTRDRRQLRSPIFISSRDGGDEQDVDPKYREMSRLERARFHLNQARRMYSAGRSKMELGLTGRADPARVLGPGEALQYRTDPTNRQRPHPEKQSALTHLWMAYRYVRDYEVNPSPPLLPQGNLNMERVQDDILYKFIMGTQRMEPNRLGIGRRARQQWLEEDGRLDIHYFRPFSSAAAEEEEDAAEMLYGNVPADHPYGPERSQMMLEWWYRHHGTTPIDVHQVPTRDIGTLRQWTDMSRALMNIHQHFPPPRFHAPAPSTNPTEKPPPTVFDAYMTPGEPYPVRDDNNGDRYDGWPFLRTAQDYGLDRQRYVPVYFPTGISLDGTGPPYKDLGVPEPRYGLPDDKAIPPRWDARMAADLLITEVRRLKQRAERLSSDERAQETMLRGQEIPDYVAPTHRPLQLWRAGPVAVDTAKGPAEQLWRGTSTVMSEPASLYANNDMQLETRPSDRPFFMNGRLPDDKETQTRLLMHALYLLSAPRNAWAQQYLPQRLWLDEPLPISRDAGSATYGDSPPGQGYYRRTNDNRVDSRYVGWRHYAGMFRQSPVGGVRGRETASQGRIVGLAGEPIGPLYLDPAFASSDRHVPGQTYRPDSSTLLMAWVVKTNQMTVLNANTWGLDFYFEAS
jgi:hypothetical protein